MEPMVFTPASAVANLRRSSVIGVVLSAIGIAVASTQGHPWFGVFGFAGMVLGALNNFMLQKSVLRFAGDVDITRKKFGGWVLVRLMGVTLFAIGIGFLLKPDGLGVFAGLAVFQILMLVGAAIPVMRYLRPST